MVSDHDSDLTSIIERHLKHGLGDILVGDLTMAIVDEFYEDLRIGSQSIAGAWRLALYDVSTLRSHAALPQSQ